MAAARLGWDAAERRRDYMRAYASLSMLDHDGRIEVKFRARDSNGEARPQFELHLGRDLYLSLGPAAALALAHALDVAIESARDAGDEHQAAEQR